MDTRRFKTERTHCRGRVARSIREVKCAYALFFYSTHARYKYIMLEHSGACKFLDKLKYIWKSIRSCSAFFSWSVSWKFLRVSVSFL